MKKALLALSLFSIAVLAKAQTTYYWVGNSGDSINVNSNWNTVLDGSGSSRSSSSATTDILLFDGTNFGAGFINVVATSSVGCAQMKFINNAKVSFSRIASGTSTITIAGDAGEDFVIDAGSALTIPQTSVGSLRFAMAAANTGRVSGALTMTTPLQARFDNTTGGTRGSFIFTSGSSFTTNITSSSSSYAFGSSSQSSEGWVVFQAGSDLYFDGGYSPNGSGSGFSAIDMQPGSNWHHRASNVVASFGNFFNRKNFGNVIVENNATLTALGSVYSIENLTVTAGSSFITNTSGQTVVLGDVTIDGVLSTPAGGSNTLVLGGSGTQTVSGSGTIDVGGLIVGANASVALNKSINVQEAATVNGKLNFNTFQITGAGTFSAAGASSMPSLTGNSAAGNFFISSVSGFSNAYLGSTITGNGIAPNTTVVSYSSTSDSVYLSQPVTATASGSSFTFTSPDATLETANTNGFDATTGSVAVSGDQTYESGINYIIDAATTTPFGISTGSAASSLSLGSVTFNAPVTTNIGFTVSGNLQLNGGKATIRSTDVVEVLPGATLSGTFSSSNYFVTAVNTTTGEKGVFRMDGISSSTLFPIGSPDNYLPATLNPLVASDFAATVFEGITVEGTPNGTPLTGTPKQTKVDAVWDINRVNGSGTADLQLQWPAQLEGSTFATLADTEIGIIVNQNPTWALPITPGDNTANTTTASFSGFGIFGVGAKPPSQPFIFNPIPDKTYGDADFNGGAISLNTTEPIIYSSNNPAVATVVNGDIHITGVGIATITASQASDGFYAAVSVDQQLTVNKANLTIQADDKAKPQGDPNPALTITYTGFVNGETASVLTTPASISTTATASSPAGTYPISVSGATATNYNITFVNGTLTVTPRQAQTISFNALPVKTYGNADFAAGASSTNNTIPVTYTSSNSSVATISGNNIHIVGAGTATITASQASNAFYFAAPDVSQTLTVNKANLTVKALDTSKIYGQSNPPFTITYSGFVLGESTSALTTLPTASTIANANTAPGYYPIDLSGGVANNYNFVYTSGRLTIYPASGTAEPNLQAYMSSSTTLTVKLYSAAADLGDIMVYDLSGRVIATKNVFVAHGFLSYTIVVNTDASGIYVVRVVTKNQKLDLKITVPIIK
jgi:hypothetical protein